ncbi:MAG: hypothetical protein ACFFB8_08550 [Promethearchaeota archaeon]
MKISNRIRPLLLVLLILFPMLMIISSFSLKVQAGPFIPESDPNNGWHWEVDVGDKLYFEGEFILTNASTGEVYSMWRDIWIYNITSIENVTIDWLGMHDFSQVNATQCYYNVTAGELEPYYVSQEIALFGYDSIDPITLRIRAGQNGMPYILPINGSSGVEVNILAPVINETFYYPRGNTMYNAFDNYTFDEGSNRIYFWNSTDDFYSDATYYDNGTLNYGEAYLGVNMGDSPIYVNATIKQVFNDDITDEISWGVSVGEDIYYNWYEGSDGELGAVDVKVHITEISDVLLNKTKNSFGNQEDDPIHMVFERVFGDIYVWNGTDYELVEVHEPIGTANNFYPQYFDEDGPNLFNFLYPTDITIEDLEFMWNNDTLRIWNAPFDEIYYDENGILESVVQNSTGTNLVRSEVDKTTGIVQSYLMTQGSEMLYYEIQTQTLVDWSVNPGNVLYYKHNEEEKFYDEKVTILGSLTYFANLSAMFNPMGITLPTGQPELQFFSVLMAYFEEWDSTTETWIPQGDDPIAISNIYWPISPLQFNYGPPLILPENTASSDLSNLFNVFGSVYDEINYTTGHVMLRNNTMDRELHFYFDETTGRVEMMYGWNADPINATNWRYISIYPKFYQALTSGSNSFTFNSDFPAEIDIDMDVNVAVGSPGAALIYNYFTMNPVNVPLPNGTAFAFFDQLIENRAFISGNITMTIRFPSSIDISEILFFFYAFNMSGTNEWDSPPPEFYLNSVTYNFVENAIIIEMEAWDRGILSAMAYLVIEEELPSEIPGYDLFLISLMIIFISTIVIKKKRKKI